MSGAKVLTDGSFLATNRREKTPKRYSGSQSVFRVFVTFCSHHPNPAEPEPKKSRVESPESRAGKTALKVGILRLIVHLFLALDPRPSTVQIPDHFAQDLIDKVLTSRTLSAAREFRPIGTWGEFVDSSGYSKENGSDGSMRNERELRTGQRQSDGINGAFVRLHINEKHGSIGRPEAPEN